MAGDRNTAKRTIERALESLGLTPSSLLVKEDASQISWALKRGSAAILVALVERPPGTSFRVVAPVMIPVADRRDSLFARLLEMNAEGLSNAAFGLVDGRVVVVHERPIEGLDLAEVDHAVKQVSAVADTFDDRLVAEFGGQRAIDAVG